MEAAYHRQAQHRNQAADEITDIPAASSRQDEQDDEQIHGHEEGEESDAEDATEVQRILTPQPDVAERPSPPSSRPRIAHKHSRALSVSDVDNKTCWICYSSDADQEEEDAAGSQADGEGSKGPWVHACKCALFAHQNCLLHWINEAQARSPRTSSGKPSVVCPQCRSPYHIQQRKSRLLDLMDYIDRLLDNGAIRLSVAFVGSGLIVASGVYGVAATRAFLGTKQANVLLSQNWKWSWFGNFPMIAPILILARTNLVDALLPLLPLSLLSTSNRTLPAFDPVTHIPSPTTTVILLPWLRLIYDRVYKLLARRIIRHIQSRSSLSAQTAIPETPRPIAVAFPPAAQHQPQQAQHPGDQAAAGAPEDEVGGMLANAAVTLSINLLSRIFAGALLLPFISAAAGDALLEIARLTKSPALRQLLGLQDRKAWELALASSRGHFLLRGLGLVSASSSSKTSNRTSSWLKWASLGFGTIPATTADAVAQREAIMDPAWWRNAVGGCLFILAKDALLLLRRVLDIKRKQSRKIRQVAINKQLELQLKSERRTA